MWIARLLQKYNLRKVDITFNDHIFQRAIERNLDLRKVERTITEGKIIYRLCKKPNKLCFKHYFGKENKTYIVVGRLYKYFFEVETAWAKTGR